MLDDCRALLLDMDGTLVDTEPIHVQAHLHVLADKGIHLEESDIHVNIGGSDDIFYRRLQEELGVAGDVRAWVQEKWRLVHERLDAGGLPLRPGVAELLDAADGRALPRCVVTSSDTAVAEVTLRGAGIDARLPLRVCYEDTVEHKPDPAPYRLAVQRLGCDPGECLAIEDSLPGVRSAVAAGVRCLAFSGLIAAGELHAAGAWRCVEDLRDCLR